jgi:type I restriction enzyme S subunit
VISCEPPPGWAETTLGELFDFRGGGTPDKTQSSYWNGDIPWASVKDIKGPQLLRTIDSISEDGLKNSAASVAEVDDVILVTRISPGETAVSKIRCAINQDLKIVRPPAGMAASFIRHLFRRLQPKIISLSSGTTVLGIRLNELGSINLPLPPLAEQKRIVAKIEELFSELEAGEESLRLARRQLATYRQSLLKQAFEGKLTAQWREKTKTPNGWNTVTLGTVIEEPAYGTSKKCSYESSGSGVLRIPNVVNGNIDANDLKFAEFTEGERESYQLKSGDLLMIRSNGSVSIVGRCARVEQKHTQYLYAGYLIRLRARTELVDSQFLLKQLASPRLRSQIESSAKSTSGVNNINSKEIQRLVIALPNFPEQQEIVRLLDEQFEVIERNEREIDAALQRSEALRQSILHRAFTGKLVPQNPADEPATELLARLRAGKAKATTEASGKKPRNRRLASLPKR